MDDFSTLDSILDAPLETSHLYEYEGMDPRLRYLSYSSNLTLHECPRKFQLYKLQSKQETSEGDTSSVTFAFGHAVGLGIQLALQGLTEQEIIWTLYLQWETDLFAENTKQVKSFWHAITAVQKFLNLITLNGFLRDYELVFYGSKPAVELEFRINFPDGFAYRGSVDVVLRHKITGEVVVLELKTTSATNVNAAMYKNSAQALGYSVVLDVLFPELSSYQVIYLVYKTKGLEYESMQFNKSYLQRAQWIQELLLDIETIKLYESAGIYPMRGESCFSFYRECEYINLCTLPTSRLTSPPTQDRMDELEKPVQITLTLADIIDAQLAKTGEM